MKTKIVLKNILFGFVLSTIAWCVPTNTNAQTDTLQEKKFSAKDSFGKEIIFTKWESPAWFPGGIDGWKNYLKINLRYPKKAQRKKTEGIVKVQLTVEKDGTVSNVKALNDPGNGLAEEAERVIKEGPSWKPAEQNGKLVNYRFIQTITFQLQ